MLANQEKVRLPIIYKRSLRQSLSQMQSTTFDKSSTLQSLFSSIQKTEVVDTAVPITQGQVFTQRSVSAQPVISDQLVSPASEQVFSKQLVNDNTIRQDTTGNLDVPPNDGSLANLPRTKLIALFIAPTLVLILIIIAVWTLYRKGVLTGCIRKTKKESNARSNLLEEQLRNDTSLNSLLAPYYGYRIKSQASDSIPEVSEWLESVHGSDDEKSIPFPSKDISPSILPNFTPKSGISKASIITEPKPVLSTSTDTTKSISNQKHPIFNSESFNASYQNTHILRPQDGNMWKLGGLKYSRKKSNTLVTPSPSEEKVGFMRSLWQSPKTPTGASFDNEGTRSWWSKKSVSIKQDTTIDLDNFHVW